MGEASDGRGLQVQITGSSSGARPISWPEPGIACVWLPQLPLRVEVLRRPELERRPLVLGGGPGERRLVQFCSPEAEWHGIQPGLPLREVFALCRDAIVLQPDPVRIAEVLDESLIGLQHVSPTVELQGEQFLLDLRGLREVYHADLAVLEQTIRSAIPGLLQPRVGVAAGRFTAIVAARVAPFPGIHAVPGSETRTFLALSPISHLLLDPGLSRRLELFGVHTLAELAALPFTAVQAQFGPTGARAWRLANGQDDEPVIPHRFHPAIRASIFFDDPLASIDAVIMAVDHLLARAFRDPVLNGRSVRQARLRALLADGTSWERLVSFKEALLSRDAARSTLHSKLQLPNALPVVPIEELSLELMGLGSEGAKQSGLFSIHARQERQIAEAARQLSLRFGRTPLARAVEVEPWSRIPERRWALLPYDL
jgi:nucleotidyltransferase/DNA polymerase involved in DNA repair